MTQNKQGRSLGIASMILGIVNIVFLAFCVQEIITAFTQSKANGSLTERAVVALILVAISLVFSTLAFILSLKSKKLGYKTGISRAGFILSIISFVNLLISIIYSLI
ncbi:MAG: hypothetical protein LBC71_01730 [Oscillospiraceae bacterium]|jgi:hypothetical protein|nr:hypothetical protein [Oscillospiraceae bacterium]